MEPKCSLCSFLGETPHCGNCAVIKKANTNKQFRMTNLKLTPSKLVKLVENTPVDELKECLSVGDYIEFTSEIGYDHKIRMVLLDFEYDKTLSGEFTKTTFGLFGVHLPFKICNDTTSSEKDIEFHNSYLYKYYLPNVFLSLPTCLIKTAKQVEKKTIFRDRTDISHLKIFPLSEEEIFSDNSSGSDPYEFFRIDGNGNDFSFSKNLIQYGDAPDDNLLRGTAKGITYYYGRSIRKESFELRSIDVSLFYPPFCLGICI